MLPLFSGGSVVVSVNQGGDDVGRVWRTGGPEEQAAILADDDDGAGDAGAVWLERVVGFRHQTSFIDQQVEREVVGIDEGAVTCGVGIIDAVRFDPLLSEFGDRVAHGDELIGSTGGAVDGVEQQQGASLATKRAEVQTGAGGAWESKIGREVSYLDHSSSSFSGEMQSGESESLGLRSGVPSTEAFRDSMWIWTMRAVIRTRPILS